MSIGKLLFDETYQLNMLIRFRNYISDKKIRFVPLIIKFLIYRIGHCYIHINAKLGKVKIAHPLGIVIGAGVEVGNNVTMYQGVNLVGKGGGKKGYPKVEDDVIIYADAKIIGNVTIGKGSIIGANAVVLHDVPPNSLAIGFPAKIKKLDEQQE